MRDPVQQFGAGQLGGDGADLLPQGLPGLGAVGHQVGDGGRARDHERAGGQDQRGDVDGDPVGVQRRDHRSALRVQPADRDTEQQQHRHQHERAEVVGPVAEGREQERRHPAQADRDDELEHVAPRPAVRRQAAGDDLGQVEHQAHHRHGHADLAEEMPGRLGLGFPLAQVHPHAVAALPVLRADRDQPGALQGLAAPVGRFEHEEEQGDRIDHDHPEDQIVAEVRQHGVDRAVRSENVHRLLLLHVCLAV